MTTVRKFGPEGLAAMGAPAVLVLMLFAAFAPAVAGNAATAAIYEIGAGERKVFATQ